jgi:hypothetical protein
MKKLGRIENCPNDILDNAKNIVANNIKIVNSLDEFLPKVSNAEKTDDN